MTTVTSTAICPDGCRQPLAWCSCEPSKVSLKPFPGDASITAVQLNCRHSKTTGLFPSREGYSDEQLTKLTVEEAVKINGCRCNVRLREQYRD